MHPVLFRIGPFNIYSYGVMVATGFGLATLLIYRSASKHGLPKDKIIDFSILILLSGLFGARVLYVVLNLRYYLSSPLEILDLAKGGLVWYGGFLFSIVAAAWYVKVNKLNFLKVTDFMVPYVALAQAFGRIGCFLNGCCYGTPVPDGYPCGVIFPGSSVVRHPTEIYSSLALLLIFIILRFLQEKPHFNGAIFMGYCALYSFKRFMIEFLRGDNPRVIIGLTLSQVMSIFIFVSAIIIFVYKGSEWKRRSG